MSPLPLGASEQKWVGEKPSPNHFLLGFPPYKSCITGNIPPISAFFVVVQQLLAGMRRQAEITRRFDERLGVLDNQLIIWNFGAMCRLGNQERMVNSAKQKRETIPGWWFGTFDYFSICWE